MAVLGSEPTRIFISYASSDVAVAEAVHEHFQSLGFHCYLFSKKLSFDRNQMWSNIKESFSAADVYLLILSEHSIQAEGVAVELGWLQDFRRRGEEHLAPMFSAIIADDGAFLRSLHSVRCLDDQFEPTGSEFKLPNKTQAYFKWIYRNDTDLLDRFTDSLRITYEAFGSDYGDASGMPRDWASAYLKLFPLIAEQDQPHQIEEWVSAAYHDGPGAGLELVVTGKIMGVVVAFAFLSAGDAIDWVFGNYIGTMAGWRDYGKSRTFFKQTMEACRRVFADYQGIVFEVERYDESLLLECYRRVRDTNPSLKFGRYDRFALTEEERNSIRCAKRISIYRRLSAVLGTRLQAYVLSDAKGRWLGYWQPSMKPTLSPDDEVPLWLMCIPFDQRHFARSSMLDARIAFEQIWRQVFGDFYGAANSIPDYQHYLGDFIKRRFRELREAHGLGWQYAHWEPIVIDTAIKALVWQTTELLERDPL